MYFSRERFMTSTKALYLQTEYRVAPRRVAAHTDDVRMISSYNDQGFRRVSHIDGALDRLVESDNFLERQLGRSHVMTVIDATTCHVMHSLRVSSIPAIP
jgi:putative aminopeptidase FrvX